MARSLPVEQIPLCSAYAQRMCGRYAQSHGMDVIVEEFGVTGTLPFDPLPHNWNIAPTNEIYIVKAHREQSAIVRDLSTASWGIIAHWLTTPVEARASQSHAINARSESIHEKPTFRNSFRTSRCLIPADGYYEWATALGRYKPKQPFYISRADERQISFAGIFSQWTSPTGVQVQSAAVITREAVGELATIHSRMPVIMRPERWDDWLDPLNHEITHLQALMTFDESKGEYPDFGLVARPVSDRVNLVANNGVEVTKGIELGEPETLF